MTNIINNCRYPEPTSVKRCCPDCCYKNICENTIQQCFAGPYASKYSTKHFNFIFGLYYFNGLHLKDMDLKWCGTSTERVSMIRHKSPRITAYLCCRTESLKSFDKILTIFIVAEYLTLNRHGAEHQGIMLFWVFLLFNIIIIEC